MSESKFRELGSAVLSKVVMENVLHVLPTLAKAKASVTVELPKNFKFAESTNLGMTVRRAMDVLVLENADMTEDNFRIVFEDEPMCRRDISDIAYSMARLARGAYTAISDNVAPVVESLVSQTEEKIQQRLTKGNSKDVVLEHFQWGALSDPLYLNMALSVCLDEAGVFRQDLPVRGFYKDSCMTRARTHLPKTVSEKDIKATEAFFSTAEGDDAHRAQMVTFVTRGYPFQNLIADADSAIKSRASAPLVELVSGMAKAVDLLQDIRTFEKTTGDDDHLPESVVENIKEIETSLFLIHGAVEVKRELDYANSVFMCAQEASKESVFVVCNDDALAAYEEAGGTDKALSDLGRYFVEKKSINAKMPMSTEEVLKLCPSAMAAIEGLEEREIQSIQRNEVHAVRTSMNSVMTAWLGDLYKEGFQRVPYEVAQSKVNRAVTEATRTQNAVPVSDGYADVVLTVIDSKPLKEMQARLRDALKANAGSDKLTIQAKAIGGFVTEYLTSFAQ